MFTVLFLVFVVKFEQFVGSFLIKFKVFTHNGVVELPPFHGCGLRNINGTKKLVDYRNANQCLCGVWSDENCKIEYGTYPMTRYMTQGRFRYLYKNKGNCLWDYKTKEYVHMLDTPVRDNFNYFLELKMQHLNSDK